MTCDVGYTGPVSLDNNETGGIIQCLKNGSFTSFECAPNPCTPLQVPLSELYGISTVGVQGNTGDVVQVTCQEPFASGNYSTTCQTDGTFTPVECVGIPQCATEYPEGSPVESFGLVEDISGGGVTSV